MSNNQFLSNKYSFFLFFRCKFIRKPNLIMNPVKINKFNKIHFFYYTNIRLMSTNNKENLTLLQRIKVYLQNFKDNYYKSKRLYVSCSFVGIIGVMFIFSLITQPSGLFFLLLYYIEEMYDVTTKKFDILSDAAEANVIIRSLFGPKIINLDDYHPYNIPNLEDKTNITTTKEIVVPESNNNTTTDLKDNKVANPDNVNKGWGTNQKIFIGLLSVLSTTCFIYGLHLSGVFVNTNINMEYFLEPATITRGIEILIASRTDLIRVGAITGAVASSVGGANIIKGSVLGAIGTGVGVMGVTGGIAKVSIVVEVTKAVRTAPPLTLLFTISTLRVFTFINLFIVNQLPVAVIEVFNKLNKKTLIDKLDEIFQIK